MSSRMTGTVEWFDGSKGFGYIESVEGKKVFVHYSAITGKGIHNLREGEQVEFTVESSPRGPQAAQVVRL